MPLTLLPDLGDLLRLHPQFNAGTLVEALRHLGAPGVLWASSADPDRVLVHHEDREDPTTAFALAQLDGEHIPVGIFRRVARPTYDDLVRGQVAGAVAAAGGAVEDEDIAALLAGKDTWTVE